MLVEFQHMGFRKNTISVVSVNTQQMSTEILSVAGVTARLSPLALHIYTPKTFSGRASRWKHQVRRSRLSATIYWLVQSNWR